MTAEAEVKQSSISIIRPIADAPILSIASREDIAIMAGVKIEIDGKVHNFETDTDVEYFDGPLVPGRDYGLTIDEAGRVICDLIGANPIKHDYFAGFHFAPGGCASSTSGGDAVPAINPRSLWDIGFRPSCFDPRGMALVETDGGKRFWADIYLLGVDHIKHGTSRCGATIADGRDLPKRMDGSGKVKRLDFATASEICAHHGKRLLTAEEFFAAAYGVKERCSRDDEPTITGSLDDGAERFISKLGLFDATGTMWQWGTDGHPDDPRPSLFGGSWVSGGLAGSRYAYLGYWAGDSDGRLGVRAASDHLNPA